jgi:hypothetical protein
MKAVPRRSMSGTARILQFRSRDHLTLERLIGKPCPWCGQVIYKEEIPKHLQFDERPGAAAPTLRERFGGKPT